MVEKNATLPSASPGPATPFKIVPCVIVPCFNHAASVPGLLEDLSARGIPTVIVDDGSVATERELLIAAAHPLPWVHLVHLERNGGKGAAVTAGLRWAKEQGFTHAIQVDADRQHRVADIPRFLEAAEGHPDALILGQPVFGEDVPLGRLLGRQLSRVCVFLSTLSRRIGDPLFGFRLYPLEATVDLLDRANLPSRMDFDPELAVRLCWRGLPIINLPTEVSYPTGGISNFRLWRDNARISWMHTRLIAGMIPRAPRLLLRRRG